MSQLGEENARAMILLEQAVRPETAETIRKLEGRLGEEQDNHSATRALLAESQKKVRKMEDREQAHYRVRGRLRYRLQMVKDDRTDPGTETESEGDPGSSRASAWALEPGILV